MKFTEHWLHDHLDTSAPLKEITDKLTAIGLEIESVEDLSDKLKAFIIAEVVSAKPHPNADRLQVCTVNFGDERPLEVVCGAPNARAGMRGVFAPVGSDIPGTGLHLKAGEIRGVASNGMLCSERELMLSDEHDGIIDLPSDAPIGTPYAEWAGLSEAVIEVNITPNRGDCLSVRGIARDLAAAGMGTLKPLSIKNMPIKDIKSSYPSPLKWVIDSDDKKIVAMGRGFRNVKNGDSPEWMQKRLKAIGLRPISALVDITNYVTFDLGRPLHVFDCDKLQGDKLTIRSAKQGEEFLALDGKNYKLQEGMTVIADGSGVQGLGGVMGAEHSGCTETTTNVFLEVALFCPNRTAKTGRALAIESDARYRFERGVDSQFLTDGMRVASQLITEICGGEASEPTATEPQPQHAPTPITLSVKRLQQFSGAKIPAEQSLEILQNLGFSADLKGDNLTATAPSWRTDIEGDHCLIEEILRIYGFDKVQAVSLPKSTLPQSAVSPQQNRQQYAAQALSMRGYNESVSWSFTSEELADIFFNPSANNHGGKGERGGRAGRVLSNPISSQLTHMRPSVLCHLTSFAVKNRDRGYGDLALFEVGPVFYGDTADTQYLHISGLRCGSAHPPHWDTSSRPPRPNDIFDIKADVMEALRACKAPVENLQTRTEDLPAYYHPGKAAGLYLGKIVVAHFGELHPQVISRLDLPQNTLAFEIYMDNLPPLKATSARTRPPFNPSQLQAVMRDFAFVASADTSAESILSAVRAADKKLITNVELFDLYSDDSMAGKRSLALRVTIQSFDKTMEDADIEKISQTIIDSVHKKTGAQLRQ